MCLLEEDCCYANAALVRGRGLGFDCVGIENVEAADRANDWLDGDVDDDLAHRPLKMTKKVGAAAAEEEHVLDNMQCDTCSVDAWNAEAPKSVEASVSPLLAIDVVFHHVPSVGQQFADSVRWLR